MHVELPSDTVQFVQGLVASGQYKSADEALADGVRLLMSRQQLRVDIQKGISELDAGQGIDVGWGTRHLQITSTVQTKRCNANGACENASIGSQATIEGIGQGVTS